LQGAEHRRKVESRPGESLYEVERAGARLNELNDFKQLKVWRNETESKSGSQGGILKNL
jgi:hypothetical protein